LPSLREVLRRAIISVLQMRNLGSRFKLPQNLQFKRQNQDLNLDLPVPNPMHNILQSLCQRRKIEHLWKLKGHKNFLRSSFILRIGAVVSR
jgi:hypothetical protein